MPGFYLALKDGQSIIPDREEIELPDEEVARLYAVEVARELMRNREESTSAWRISF
jgi:hypothetical protein